MTSADWANKDFYKVLGVSKDASSDEIKKAYRKLARENHPDSHPGDKAAEERFKQIAEAYDVIGDPEKRRQYDEMRSAFSGGFGPFTTTGTGADIETEATIGFEESIEGCTVQLRLTSDAPCPDCSGTGARSGTVPRVCPECDGVGMRVASVGGAFTMNETCPACGGRGLVVDDPCPTCHGSGRGLSNRTISARIPAGVKDGQRIRLRGKGASGERGGPPGDLYVTVHVAPHPVFGRRGDNLTITVPVSFDEAALGADIKVPTLGGAPVTVKIPPGTPNGRTFRVRGKGAPGKGGHRGDLLVTVEVQVPAVLDERQRQAVQAYREATSGADLRSKLFQGGM